MTVHDENNDGFASDFADLPDDEAEELARIAGQLKADQPAVDDAFFLRLEQQIANQIAVTPIPGQSKLGAARGKAGFWRRLFSVPGLLVAASAAVVALAVWFLIQPPAPGSGRIDIVWATPDAGSADTGSEHAIPQDQIAKAIILDDALWDRPDGFFGSSAVSLDEEYASLLLDGVDGSIFGHPSADDDRLDPLNTDYNGGVWGELGGLSTDELNALDAILGG